MAAEVSGQMKGGLITRDLLGGCFGIESKELELDLDLHVPSGWEKRLDLKSGKVFIQRCNPTNSASDQSNSIPQSPLSSSITMSSPSKPTLNLLDNKNISLKQEFNPFPSTYTSVCTLDKVKSALDRAERTSTLSSSSSSSSSKKRRMFSSSSSISNSSSVKQGDDKDEPLSSREQVDQNGLVITACPNCLLYVLVSKHELKCPQCNIVIELPSVTKKPKIDLNMPT